MSIGGVPSILAFKSIPTTILVVLIYLVSFSAILVTDQVQNVPKDQGGLNLAQAYSDLHEIAARPHPYNSHANDLVHSYILSRLTNATSDYPHVHIVDDLTSNGSWWSSRGYSVSFEGTNILVKIDGSDPKYLNNGGVLFSAHYDSVSTAMGAADDGMGVATLMQMIQYFAANRPKRTVVFNINNGEEDWLNGAHAFLLHPWSNITDVFLNLEGASSGGRPILFRATSTSPVRSFTNAGVLHPHANVLSADSFAMGLIRTGTDFSVYSAHGMEGMDFAFYKGRSKYHTLSDSIPHIIGGQGALWAMLESVRGAGVSLANDDLTHAPVGGTEASVYFDLFGAYYIVFTLDRLIHINVALLVAGPILLIFLLIRDRVSQHSRRQGQKGKETFWEFAWIQFKNLAWLNGVSRRAKFWLAFTVTTALQVILVLGYVKLNAFIVYSSPYVVAVSTFTLAYLSLVGTLNLPIIGGSLSPEQQKRTVFVQTYILTWVFLVLATVTAAKFRTGGLYWVTAWNAAVLHVCAVSYVGGQESVEAKNGSAKGTSNPLKQTDRAKIPEMAKTVEENEDSTEVRLATQQRTAVSPAGKEDGGAGWIAQLLTVVLPPVVLVGHITVLLLNSMPQTLADGNKAVIVYASISFLTFLLVIPLAPFTTKFHRFFTYIIALLFITSTAYAWLSFPFSQENGLKVFFQQKLTLDLNAAPGSNHQVVAALTSLSGAPGYINDLLIPNLPSSQGRDVACEGATDRPGLLTCTWESALFPAPGDTDATLEAYGGSGRGEWQGTWIEADVARTGPHAARISVAARNSRSCRVYFDNVRVKGYRVQDVEGGEGEYFAPANGVAELRLWSRTWDRRFVVDVDWNATTDSKEGLKGRVACEWVEYESGSVGVGSGGKIPALEEVLKFLPRWAAVSKMTDGLVEAWAPFEV